MDNKSKLVVCDFWEVKPLTNPYDWFEPGLGLASLDVKSSLAFGQHLEQLSEQAAALFAHFPDCKKVYAHLITGPFFTTYVFQSRAAPPRTPTRIKKLDDELDKVYQRPLPEVIGELAVQNVFYQIDPNSSRTLLNDLTPKFLLALHHPVRDLVPKASYQSSWFLNLSQEEVKPNPAFSVSHLKAREGSRLLILYMRCILGQSCIRPLLATLRSKS